MLPALLLTGLALVLAGLAPRAMARLTALRRSPGPALVLWQSMGLSAVLSALFAGPAAVLWLTAGQGGDVLDRMRSHPLATAVAVGLSLLMVGQLLWSGHTVGTGLRDLRRRHRELVDVLADELPTDLPARVRVLPHPSPTAYCLPGLRGTVVLSSGALATLSEAEVRAVLAHERAHLHARHDLVLEFFSVLHHAVPAPVRSPEAMAEVQLLVEALADRSALRQTGAGPLARALAAMLGAPHPDASLASGAPAGQTSVRLGLIAAAADPAPWRAAGLLAASALVLMAPWALLTWALTASV